MQIFMSTGFASMPRHTSARRILRFSVNYRCPRSSPPLLSMVYDGVILGIKCDSSALPGELQPREITNARQFTLYPGLMQASGGAYLNFFARSVQVSAEQNSRMIVLIGVKLQCEK